MTTPDRTARLEKAYLLPVPLSKPQFGAWWTAALDEGIVIHGECVWPVDLWLDPAQLRREPQPFEGWHPGGDLEPFTVMPAEKTKGDWLMDPGSLLRFRQIDGLVLQLETCCEGEELLLLAFDARLFDERLQWISPAARDRLLQLVSRCLATSEPELLPPPLIEPKPAQLQAALALQQRLR